MAAIFGSDSGSGNTAASNAAFRSSLNKVYTWYTGGFIGFVVVLAVLEQMGLSRQWIGLIFLLATIGLYAGIGIMSRTSRCRILCCR
jgi:cation/acetate symporter